MNSRFNSQCAYHVGKCKCSYRRRAKPKHSEVISNGEDYAQSQAADEYACSERSSTPPIRYGEPKNVVNIRIYRLIKCIQNLGMDSTPIVYLPSRIGESDMLDMAAEALIQLSMGSGYSGNTILNSTPVRSKYAQSMTLVRKHLDTWNRESGLDALVGTVSLLGIIDVLAGDDMRSKSQTALEFLTHWNGISNLLLCGSPSAAGSEIARASMTLAACSTFAIPCFQGMPSPFEVDHWLAAEPVDLHPTTLELRTLNICSHQLSVKLPRLIAMVRQLRESFEMDLMRETIALSEALYACREPTGESWVLNRTKICSTNADENTRSFIPCSMEFSSPREMTAAVLYWQSRIVAVKIYNILHASCDMTPSGHVDCTAEELQLANNILMAWPYGSSKGFCATAPFAMGFICVWLVCRNIENLHGLPTKHFQNWILRTLDVCHGGWAVGSTAEDLDAAADVLAGGPLIGHLADIVRQLRSVRQS